MASTSDPQRRVTIADVARAASVHHSTASRALRGDPSIHPQTVLLVRAAATELGYRAATAPRLPPPVSERAPIVVVVNDQQSFTGISPFAQAFWFFLGQSLTTTLSGSGISVVHTTTDSLRSLTTVAADLLVLLSILDAPLELPSELSHVPVIMERGRSDSAEAAGVMGHDHAVLAVTACERLVRGARSGVRWCRCRPRTPSVWGPWWAIDDGASRPDRTR
ncbi:MAG: LacI family DNA-binding transcriptional regulator [Candidatus Nanopelagicales bacterium]